MYTQHPRRANVPENYSGNAFRYPPIGSLVPSSDEVTRDTPDALSSDEALPCRPSGDGSKEQLHLALEPNRGDEAEHSLFPFNLLSAGRGIGSEELLLIGLFLLLTGGDSDGEEKREKSDLLFYLLLLFFCG